jgi:hypothetical protein
MSAPHPQATLSLWGASQAAPVETARVLWHDLGSLLPRVADATVERVGADVCVTVAGESRLWSAEKLAERVRLARAEDERARLVVETRVLEEAHRARVNGAAGRRG